MWVTTSSRPSNSEGADHSEFLARLSPRTTATKGQPIDLVVDVTRLHFFDPETGLAIYGDDGA